MLDVRCAGKGAAIILPRPRKDAGQQRTATTETLPFGEGVTRPIVIGKSATFHARDGRGGLAYVPTVIHIAGRTAQLPQVRL